MSVRVMTSAVDECETLAELAAKIQEESDHLVRELYERGYRRKVSVQVLPATATVTRCGDDYRIYTDTERGFVIVATACNDTW